MPRKKCFGYTCSLLPQVWRSALVVVAAAIGGGCGSQYTQSTNTGMKTLTSIQVTPADPSAAVGAAQQFSAIGNYSDGSTADLTSTARWSSSNTEQASITNSGLATAAAIGRPQITATSGAVSGSTALIIVSAAGPSTPRFAYVADIVDGTISMYTVNPVTGQLR